MSSLVQVEVCFFFFSYKTLTLINPRHYYLPWHVFARGTQINLTLIQAKPE